jgi:WD40 repeat protein
MLRCIGRGSFGEVWLARNALGLYRAVKVVRRDQMKGQRDYEREFAGLLNFEPISRTHDGFVDILQVGRGEGDDWFYYVMELADDAGQIPDAGYQIPDSSSQSPISGIRHPVSGITDPATYSPLTLSTRIRAAGRLPVAECIRLGLALTAALDHLHRHNLVHRDIKPANLIFVNGQPKLADIGLVADTSEPHTIVGTPGFMPNENAGTVQADLYALGKVLYAASTGHGATAWPAPVTSLAAQPDQQAWLDLNEIVNTACHPDPKHRYASAVEMQAELASVQNGESPHSRRLWKKRFKQAAWALAGVAVLVGAGLYLQSVQLRAAQRSLAFLDLEKAIRPPHTAGWSTTAWEMASNAAVKFGFDTNLQSQAAASLAGLDAHCLFQTNGVGGSSVAFSPDGKSVLFGALDDGTTNAGQAHLLDLTTTNLSAFPVPGEGPVAFLPNGTPVQLSADTNNRLALWIGPSHGRRADAVVRSNSTPASASGLGEGPSIGNSAAGGGARAPQPTALRTFTLPAGATIGALTALALTPNASHVAASGTDTAGTPFLAAWDGPTGRLLLPVAASLASAANSAPEAQRRSPEPPLRGPPATALAFTPDGSLLAAGHDSGEVSVCRVRRADAPVRSNSAPAGTSGLVETSTAAHLAAGEGTRAPIAVIPASRLPILSLAFCRDYVHDPFSTYTEPQWLLAIGDSGGGVSIWEVPKQRLRTRCLGADYGVSALAYNPDGSLLASAGRRPTKMWDTATGREVLSVKNGDMFTGVAFSADGVKVAFSSEQRFIAAQLNVWLVQNGRGIRTLRGLSTPVTRLCCSSNGHLVAAVSHNWQVGLWDAASNRLLHVFNVPRGTFTADNAGLAFSPDGSQFAFMSGTNAMLLSLPTGNLVTNWHLPPGYVDELAFTPAGHLLAFRVEPTNAEAAVFAKPTVPRIRDLTARPVHEVLMTLPEYDGGVSKAAWSPDAAFIAVDGLISTAIPTNRVIELVAPLRTAVLWTNSVRVQAGARSFFLDAAGLLLETWLDQSQPQQVIEAISRRQLYSLRSGSIALNSAASLCLRQAGEGWSLHSLSNGLALLHFASTGTKPTNWPDFGREGRMIAVGNEDGSVSVCDLEEMRLHLNESKLGW